MRLRFETGQVAHLAPGPSGPSMSREWLSLGGASLAERQAGRAQDIPGRRMPCLWRGSGNPEDLITRPHIDGLFIGRSARTVAGDLDIPAKCAAKL